MSLRTGILFLFGIASTWASASLAPVGGVARIDAGGTEACVVTTSGGVMCWGANDQGQLGDGTTGFRRPLPGFVAGLGDGAGAVAVSVARENGAHACAITASGGVKCWGANGSGQLGDGTTTPHTTPVDVTGLPASAIAIAAGAAHTCAVLSTGAVKCWGANGSGELGDGTNTPSATPVDVTGLSSGIVAITAGAHHTCTLDSSAGVLCWGDNAAGQLGDGTTTMRFSPVPVQSLSSGVASISAGGTSDYPSSGRGHTCAITTSGAAKCWGDNSWGELGEGTQTSHLTPVDVATMTSGVLGISTGGVHDIHIPTTSLTDGRAHTCAVTSAGAAKCWGDNLCGQVGDGRSPYSCSVSATDPIFTTEHSVLGIGIGAMAIAAGGTFSCVLMADDSVLCWGDNERGQLGDGDLHPAGTSYPVPVMTGTLAQAIVLGAILDVAIGAQEAIPATGGGSGNPVTLASLTPTVCSASGLVVQGLAQGKCTIAANQAGATYYDPAPQVTFDLRVGDPLAQTITFAPAPTVVIGGDGIVSATASSGLPVTFSSNTPSICTVGNGVVATGIATGTCTIAANQAGDRFHAAVEATQSFTVGTGTIVHALMVTKLGAGTGQVSSSPIGIDCGAACGATFSSGQAVTLSATPDTGSIFAGWNGACRGVTGPCTVSMDSAKTAYAVFDLPTGEPRLGNISTRGQVLGGSGVMIGGFVIGGTTPKTVVVRAIGPSLANYGVSNSLSNPTFQLVKIPDQTVVASNDNWADATNALALAWSGFAPSDPRESATLVTLDPGAYTAVVSGVAGTSGVALVEVYELDHPETPLINISTRGQIVTSGGVMIGGFVIQGSAPRTVLIRALGPSLTQYSIPNPLANPLLQLVRMSDSTIVATNDNWGNTPNAAQIQASGLAPSNPFESAILLTLDPGSYTAIVSGVGGATGVGIVEVYAQ